MKISFRIRQVLKQKTKKTILCIYFLDRIKYNIFLTNNYIIQGIDGSYFLYYNKTIFKYRSVQAVW